MESKILENWSRIEEIEKEMREKTGDPEAGFNASTFWFGNDGRHLGIPCMYRKKKKKNGVEYFTDSHKEIMIMAKYCPFTGKPLYENKIE